MQSRPLVRIIPTVGQAAANRTAVLDTARQSLAAVDDVRSLCNALAAENRELATRLDKADAEHRSLAVGLEKMLVTIGALQERLGKRGATIDEHETRLDAHTETINELWNSGRNFDARLCFNADMHRAFLDRTIIQRFRWILTGR